MTETHRPRFHLAFPVHDLELARRFYAGLLGCDEGREAAGQWIDFNFYGHQLVAHLAPGECGGAIANEVDGQKVPVRHFGLLMEWVEWEGLARRLGDGGADFLIEPHVRFEGQAGEQGTFFIIDPSGNALEFKTFRNEAQIFAR
ncbi:MAG: glyoxalase [Hyphobacterium sp.]|nr:MAG: glyoxalase [Hyphobacterium sp.]